MEQEPSGQEGLLQAIQTIFGNLAGPIHTELMEQSARLSAQRYLLEMLYANQFLSNPQGFTEFMEAALDQTRRQSTRAEPMPEDTAMELQARVATSLQRFQESVELRLHQGVQD